MCDLKTLLKNNIQEVVSFIKENTNNARIRKDGRVSVNCPYCGDDTKSHLYINIDWANFKCFRCDTTGSIYKIMKDYGLAKEFSNLIQSFNENITINDIKNELTNNNCNIIVNKDIINKKRLQKRISEFKKEYNVSNIKNNKKALEYLNSRTNGFLDLDNIVCDDNYIYLPIINNNSLIMYLGRLYNKNNNKLKRYIVHKFEDREVIGFFDEFLNSNSNKLYICEGYFDAYSVNQSFNKNISICVFGKYSRKIIEALNKYLPNSFDITLLLDSENKDKNIKNSIDKFYNILSKYFNNVSICSLPYSDCNDIFIKEGKEKLKEIIINNTTSYIKYKLLRG